MKILAAVTSKVMTVKDLMKIKNKHYNIGNQHNKKPDSDRASARVEIRIKQADKEMLEAKAEKAGLKLSQYILNKLL